ncbi:hypothetical protein P167DRAFT_571931 [Morchella conica CCBAS932]|uniref:Uncharacterized protein n=1 Tax=Morchella conica CCBAS932 TaxID=1392247 RepID=A0A3N4KX16_9PEZI|nr:hypothetical protein P167DRAFT_571931 [Morchella conica CCBAS932]
MSTRVPTSWEEDWAPRQSSTNTRPNPAAPAFSPRILRPDSELYTFNGQPRTTYRPELKILKRTPDTPEVPAPVVTSEETDKSRRERERKEKERRYQEARERIMGKAASSSSSPSTPANTNSSNNSTPKQQQKQGKRSPDANTTPKSKSPSQTPNGSGKHSTNNSRGTTPVSRSRTPSRRSSPPRNNGAITGFSLNGGEFTNTPVVPVGGRRYLQKVDGKLLESQLTARDSQEIVVDRDPEGGVYLSEGGLDWDDFSREPVVPAQQQSQQWYGTGAVEYDYYNNGNNGHYGNGNNYGNGNGNYGNGNVNGGYDYISQFQPRQTQNPGIYGAAAGEGRFVYDKPQVPPAPAPASEKNVRAPGSMQAGVIRTPRGPDGSRGFKGRGAGPAQNGGQGRYS